MKRLKIEDYLQIGKKYLALKSVIEQYKFSEDLKKKIPKSKYKVFDRWSYDVALHEGHAKSKQTNSFYLKRLETWLKEGVNKK